MTDHLRPRIFGIGLNKTGTTSLHEALQILGYTSLHYGGPETMASIRKAIVDRKPVLHYVDPAYNAFSDTTITHYYHLADVQYPGSKFILTVRDLDGWLSSRRRHVEKNQQRKAAGEYHDDFLKVDVERWTAEFQRHYGAVRSYFAGRADDLLIYDVVGGDGWERLCAFLERDVPEAPFPRKNVYSPYLSKGHVSGARGQ